MTDAICSLVDPRETGILTQDKLTTFDRVVLLASTFKAGLQWFFSAGKDEGIPRFAIEAERYLSEMPIGLPVTVGTSKVVFHTGPVAHRRGARGAAGRLDAVAKLIADLAEPMLALNQEDLHQHLQAHWARNEVRNAVFKNSQTSDDLAAAQESFKRTAPLPKIGWVLPRRLGETLFFAMVYGTFIDLLREQNFRWGEATGPETIADVAARFLEDVDIGNGQAEPVERRRSALEKVARQLILTSLRQLGIKVSAEIFRGLPG